mmetsp:Transcript_13299/g.31917  ORF Transcript_13299/g.31917 Transcript_13299/m.31917 type:complete len:142 (+) Transcript_13299:985-1410(+)
MSGRSNEDLAKFLGDMACDFGMACLMGISGGVAGIGGLGVAADAAFAASSLAASSVAGWPSVTIASCTAVTGIGVAAFGAVMIYAAIIAGYPRQGRRVNRPLDAMQQNILQGGLAIRKNPYFAACLVEDGEIFKNCAPRCS